MIRKIWKTLYRTAQVECDFIRVKICLPQEDLCGQISHRITKKMMRSFPSVCHRVKFLNSLALHGKYFSSNWVYLDIIVLFVWFCDVNGMVINKQKRLFVSIWVY